MKFDANLIDSFDSPFEFALYINMYFGGLRMLDFVGQKLVHTFLYEKKKDMTYYREVNTVMSFRCQYKRVLETEIDDCPDFDSEKEIAMMVICREDDSRYIEIVPIEFVKQAYDMNPVPLKIMKLNF